MTASKILTAFVVAAAIAPVLGSCSKDDAPDRPNSSVVSDIEGTRVTSVNNVNIQYDDKGRAFRFVNGQYNDDMIEIDYSKNKLYLGDIYDGAEEIDVKFNDKGFITEMSSSWDEKDDGYQYKGSGKLTFSYDKDNCLTSMKSKTSETEKDLSSKDTYKYEEESTYTFTWRNGNLTKLDFNETEKEDGEKETYRSYTDVDYSNDENTFRQFPLSFLDHMDADFTIFFTVGLFGNGPKMLPESMTYTDEDDDYTRTYNISFNLNSNGSFNRENGPFGTVQYGYSDITRAAFAGDKAFRFTTRSLFKGSKKH